jgi:putative transposase
MVATDSFPLLELLRNAGVDQAQFLRESLEWMLEKLMEAEVAEKIGAERYERATTRTNQRNGSRFREFDTRLGTLELRIPKLRRGSYFPAFLEPRRRSEQALAQVIQEAYVLGVSTRKVDELVQALGMTGVSKSQVSRIAAELDERVGTFRERPLEGEYPYVWLDAKYLKIREGDRVMSMAFVVATGVRETGEREVLGFDVGLSEDEAFWKAFLRSLVARGLKGVKLAISDAHEGLKAAIAAVLQGASWQRCRVHFMRSLLSHVPKHAQAAVAALVRTIFVQPHKKHALIQLGKVAESLRGQYPKAAEILLAAQDDILAHMSFPREHWRQLHSTNPLERLMREIGRRADVVAIFPNRAAALRLVGSVLMEQHDEWLAATRPYFALGSMKKVLNPAREEVAVPHETVA